MNAQFNAQHEIELLKKHKNLVSQKRYRVSSLEAYRAELVSLRKSNATYKMIASWLSIKKNLKVSHTTVMRYLKKLPEIKNEIKEVREPSSLDIL